MFQRFPALVLTAVAATSVAHAQTSLFVDQIGVANARLGCAIAASGNLDNDNYPDFLLGHYGNRPQDDSKGGARLHFGSTAMGQTFNGPLQIDPFLGNAPNHVPGDQLGYALAFFGDASGDGRTEYAVAAPNSDGGRGRVYIYRAAMTTITSLAGNVAGDKFGFAVAGAGDIDHDGAGDLAVAAPFEDFNGVDSGVVRIYSGAAFMAQQLVVLRTLGLGSANDNFGYALAGGSDVDRDGWTDVLVGNPGDNYLGSTVGSARLCSGHTGAQLELLIDTVVDAGFGKSVALPGDLDGDTYPDVIVGAPDSDEFGTNAGKVIVYSGRALTLNLSPTVMFSLHGAANSNFGQALGAAGDVNGDGFLDFIVGAPNFDGLLGPANRGAAYVFSGKTGLLISARFGSQAGESLGAAVAGAGDLDHDGYADILVGSPNWDDGAFTNAGKVELWSVFPTSVTTYCTGKTNSAGCVPSIGFQGSPDFGTSTTFNVTGSSFLNQKNGLLFFGFRPNDVAFQGGTLCVASPVIRTFSQNSGGSSTGTDCTGTYLVNFNALIHSGAYPALGAGTEVCTQWWSRDPASASTTSLSNALHFTINP